jgi:CheY-like chemotaxis protein
VRLAALGAECLEAADGAEALALTGSSAPDLLIIDVGMPRMNGFELVDVLRRGSARALPLLVYAGRDLTLAERKALVLGDTRHLTKTKVSEDELVGAVRELLDGLLEKRAEPST